MTDLIPRFWPLVDVPEPVFPYHTVAAWPAGALEQLVALGILHAAENAAYVLCPQCFDHDAEVIALEKEGGQIRLMIECPDVARLEVSPAVLQQWAIHFGGLVSQIACALQLGGTPLELIPGRLWRLGRTKWCGVKRDVVFARGFGWDDGIIIVSAIGRATRPIVLSANRAPDAAIWPGRVPPVLDLAQFATLSEGRLELDHEAIASAISETESPTASQASTFTVDQLKRVVRSQLKAETRTQLSDDVFAEAYRREGSYRKAATFLSERTGREITKDQVAFAVRRMGGVAAVARDQDSESIVRTVAAQRRDRTGRTMNAVKIRDLKGQAP